MSTEMQAAYNDEIDLRTLITPVWHAKVWIISIGLMLALLVFAYQLGGIALDKTRSANVQVHFNFKGADSGSYPNGTSFSPQELLSGSVLSELYRKLDTDDYTYEQLVEAIVLKPNFNGADQLAVVVTDLVSQNKGLSTKEFSSAVSEYTNTLTNQSKTHISLAMDLNLVSGNFEKATYILTQIPTIWASQALEDRGVLSTSIPTISGLSARLISDELLVRVNVLSDTHSLLSQQVELLINSSSNRTITDPSSNFSLSDLSHNLAMEDKYRISILKELIVKHGIGVSDDDWYEGFRDARLGKLQRERSSLERLVIVYEDAINQFNQQQNQLANSSNGTSNTDQTTVYAPQYGEDVINTLLQLGSKMADPAYRKELLAEKIALSTRLQKIITEIEFYESDNDGTKQDLSADQVAKLINESFSALDKVNTALIKITDIANASRLDDRGELYDLVGKITKQENSNLSRSTLLKVILAFIVGCMLATVIVLFRRMMGQP